MVVKQRERRNFGDRKHGKALGHGSAAVTSGIYTHMFDNSHKETIDRVTEAIQQFKKTGKAT